MNIEVRRNSKEIIIEVAGRLDTTTAPTLDNTINENIADATNLILDLKELNSYHNNFSTLLIEKN